MIELGSKEPSLGIFWMSESFIHWLEYLDFQYRLTADEAARLSKLLQCGASTAKSLEE